MKAKKLIEQDGNDEEEVPYRPQDDPGMPEPPQEVTNTSRANWAGAALDFFRGQTGTDPEDAVSDFLADLLHYCNQRGLNFDEELTRARGHYETELAEDPP